MEDPIWPSNRAEDIIQELDLDRAPAGEITRQMIHLVSDGIGMPVLVPVLIARGLADGPVLVLTAAVHGNELNGIPVVQRAGFPSAARHGCWGTGSECSVPPSKKKTVYRRYRPQPRDAR